MRTVEWTSSRKCRAAIPGSLPPQATYIDGLADFGCLVRTGLCRKACRAATVGARCCTPLLNHHLVLLIVGPISKIHDGSEKAASIGSPSDNGRARSISAISANQPEAPPPGGASLATIQLSLS